MRRSHERLRVISETAQLFAAATSDYERLLHSVAHLLSEIVTDCCAVSLLAEDGLSLRAASLHANEPGALERIRHTYFAAPLELAKQPALREILATGRSLLVPRLDQTSPRHDTTDEPLLAQRELGLHSLLVVALRAHGRSLGVLSLGRFRPESPPFDEQDRELAQGLADHASLAIENARLYLAARQAAERAQEHVRLAEQTQRSLFESHDHSERLRAEAAQRESDGRLHRTLDMMREGYTILDYDLRYLYVNEVGARQARLSKEQLIGHSPMELYPDFESSGMYALLRRCANERTPVRMEEELTLADGNKVYFDVNIQPTTEGLVILSMDTTERRRTAQAHEALEEQLRQSQRMDAVGRLAGGVAHDFNNLLSIILGYGESVLEQLQAQDPLRADVQEMHKAAQRAAELTKQLLMFSRQQLVEPKILDLNEILSGLGRMLGRLLGAELELVTLMAADLGKICADRGNIEQVIMNLVVNAKDAMPKGGRLTIETTNVVLDEAFAHMHLGTAPGRYVLLTVTDTGVGMDKATRLRIFEPFYTTKEPGKGTGLGLSTVFGIVQQCGGGVWVYSEPGRGSTFKVYLPRTEGVADAPRISLVPNNLRGVETVLLVEDEAGVRDVTLRMLERHGYRVLVAKSGDEALLSCGQPDQPIHVLLTDVVMPRMSGPELATRIQQRWPAMKVLYMSGYTDGSVVVHGVPEPGVSFLQKPFTSEQLARKLRDVLDADPVVLHGGHAP